MGGEDWTEFFVPQDCASIGEEIWWWWYASWISVLLLLSWCGYDVVGFSTLNLGSVGFFPPLEKKKRKRLSTLVQKFERKKTIGGGSIRFSWGDCFINRLDFVSIRVSFPSTIYVVQRLYVS